MGEEGCLENKVSGGHGAGVWGGGVEKYKYNTLIMYKFRVTYII